MALRDLIKTISPSWLQDGAAERYLYNCELAADYVLEKMLQAVHAWMPGRGTASALPLLGQDRLIPRGLTESDASYAARLTSAFTDWQRAGTAWGLLRQALGYVLETTPAARTVSCTYSSSGTLSSSEWSSYAASGDVTTQPPRTQKAFANFNWDSLSPSDGSWGWWRWWLVLYAVAPDDWCGPAPFVIGEAGVKIGERPDASIGLNVPPSVIDTLRSVVALRGAEHAWCHEIVISFDAALFDPENSAAGGGINPDGHFGHWSKIVANQYVPARFANARYCDGVSS